MRLSDSTHTDLTHLADLLAHGRTTLAEAAERWRAACAEAPTAADPFTAIRQAVATALSRSLSEGLAAAAVAAAGVAELPSGDASGEPSLLSTVAEALLPPDAARD